MSIHASASTLVVQLLFAAVFNASVTGASLAQTAAAPGPKMKGVWEPVPYTEDIALTDVFFVTPDLGYVAGAAGTILKTTDAGATWTPLLGGDPQSQERAIMQLWFVSPTTGWATQVTSTETHLLRTTDGELWTRIGTIPEHYQDFAFASETSGVFIYNEEIHYTRDAGKTWKKAFFCSAKAQIGGLHRQLECYLSKVRYATPDVVFALGYAKGSEPAAFVVRSGDGGATWSVINVVEGESGHEGGLFFLDEQNGYFSTTYSKNALRTTDGGLTWTGMPATALHRNIVFADPSVGWSLKYQNLSYTTDGGKRWSSRELGFPAMPSALSLPRRDRAYVVGEHGMIYRYSVVPESTPVAARALPAPAMPPLDNAVLAQIERLESGLGKVDQAVRAAGSAGSKPAGDWSDPALDQQLSQLQGTVETIATGVPAMGRKHRNLNLLSYGLALLGDLTGQGNGLKEAFSSLEQSRDLASASTALQSLHSQLEAMKASVQTFQSARKGT